MQEREMKSMENGRVLGTVLMGLFLLGLAYNALVGRLERTGMARGYTAFLVVAGVLFTLARVGVATNAETAAIVLACFGASGLPMIVGSMRRHALARMQDEALGRAWVKDLLNVKEEVGRVCGPAGTDKSTER